MNFQHEICLYRVMQIKIIYLLFITVFFNAGCIGQHGNKLLGNSYAYSRFSSPGNIMVDENGKQVSTIIQERVLYVEVSNNAIFHVEKIASGKYDFNFSINPVNEFPESPGNSMSTGKPVQLFKRSGYALWKITLLPANEQPMPPAESLGHYLVQASLNEKPVKINIDKETTLMAEMRY